MAECTRFAPSPTGNLHLGHAYSALFATQCAGEAGRFIVRIEDIDPVRCRSAFINNILEDLAWLGLEWLHPVRRQSEHLAEYRAALDELRQRGLLYPCFCSRADIAREIAESGHAPHIGPDGPQYPGTCRSLSPAQAEEWIADGHPYALRLNMEKAIALSGPLVWFDRDAGEQRATPEHFGDIILGRKDVPASYHLCVTLDDARQGISLVTRGTDLFPSTHVHRLLQALFNLPTPEYRHHPLLLGPDGKRYAKRDQSLTLRALREDGKTPEDIKKLCGLSHP